MGMVVEQRHRCKAQVKGLEATLCALTIPEVL